MKQRFPNSILLIVAIIIMLTAALILQLFRDQRTEILVATIEEATPPASHIQTTATSTLYNPTTLALPGSTFPCEYNVNSPPTPTIEGVYNIPPDKFAGIGNIINTSLHNYFLKDFRTSNVWTAYINQTTVIVYAGRRLSEPKEGGVFIQWGFPGDGLPVRPYRYHPTPTSHGAVHVIDANEVTLTLEAEDGSYFQFNICDEIYVDQ